MGARPRPLLPHPQGRAARPARSSPTTPGRPASAATSRRAARTRPRSSGRSSYGVWKLHPLADWDEKRVWAYITRQRDPLQPAARDRVPVDRVHPLHPADEPRRGGARRPLGRLRQARVRHPRRHAKGDDMTENIHAHEHPESERSRGGRLHALVHRPLGVGQDDDRAHHRAGARQARARRRVPRRRHGPHAPLEGPRLLEGGPRHEHRAHRLGRLAPHAPGRRRDRGRDLPVRGDPAEGPRAGRAVRRRSSRSSSRRRSTSASSATSTASTRRRSPARSRASPASTIPTRRRESPEIVVETEGKTPEESARSCIAKLEELGLVPAAVAA